MRGQTVAQELIGANEVSRRESKITPKTSQRARLEKTLDKVPPGLLASVPAQSWQLANSNPMLRLTGMSPYRPTRREFLIGAGSLLILAPYGCGDGEGSGAGGGTTGSGTHTLEDAYGQVEVPAEPRRVVNGDYAFVSDYALVLGLPLIAAPTVFGYGTGPFSEYQRETYPEEVEDLEKVTTSPEVNFEKIATLEPDLILAAGEYTDENVYERLSEIAPTLALPVFMETEDGERGNPNWRDALRELGRGVGREERAAEFISDYEARVEDLSTRLAERWSGATFATATPFTEEVAIWGPETSLVAGILYEELGLEPASVVNPQDRELSLEAIPEIDADVLLLERLPVEGSLERDREAAAPVLNSPLWQRIPAVEKDQVYEYNSELEWPSPLCANAFLDVVERTLLG